MKIRSEDDAREAGRSAREQGKARICPLKDYPVKGLKRAWLEGWDSFIVVQEVQITMPVVEMQTRERFWPEGKPLPETFKRTLPPPCPKCKRLTIESGSQAVATRGYHNGIAYLMCRGKNCGHQFKLKIELI